MSSPEELRQSLETNFLENRERPFKPEEIARGIAYLATLKGSGHIMTIF